MGNMGGTYERAMMLAAVTGLRTALGPALLAAAHDRTDRHALALAAAGEMVLDKTSLVPSRDALGSLMARAAAGFWVTRQLMRAEGHDDPWAPFVGAGVAAGVGLIAPKLRRGLIGMGLPNLALGLAEDALALGVGSRAVGMSWGEVPALAGDAYEGARDRARPALRAVGLA